MLLLTSPSRVATKILSSSTLASLVLAFILSLSGCQENQPVSAEQKAENTALRKVQTTRLAKVPMEHIITVSGTLAAYDQVTLRAKVPGRLGTLPVDLGSEVRHGEIVAQVETEDYELRLQQSQAALGQVRARLGLPFEGESDRFEIETTGPVRQAKAMLEDARVKMERAQSLMGQGLIPRTEVEATEVSYKVAVSRYQDALEEIHNRQALLAQRRTELALAKQQLSDTRIMAPFDGVVQERQASVGEFLAAGAPVMSVVRVNPLRLKAEVPERNARNIHLQQQVRVRVEGDPNVYTGRVARLSPTISEQSRMLLVEAEVANDGSLKAGSFASVEILTDDRSLTPALPSKAIVTFAGIEKVIVVKNGKALEKPVTTGRHVSNLTEILSGVELGEQVVLNPGNLQSGTSVSVAE